MPIHVPIKLKWPFVILDSQILLSIIVSSVYILIFVEVTAIVPICMRNPRAKDLCAQFRAKIPMIVFPMLQNV